MGKGDKRSRRGKIFAGSFGKSRPKNKKAGYVASSDAATAAPAEKKQPKPRIKKKTEAA